MIFPRFHRFHSFRSFSSSTSFRHAFRSFRTISRTYRPYPYIFVLSLCAWKLTIDHVVYLPKVNGPSMSPSLSPNFHETGQMDRILLWKVDPLRSLRRGDVVSFWKPHDPEGTSLKRVIALEGDVVLLRERALHRGPPTEASEARNGNEEEVLGSVRVPYGHVWVEGDNWRRSLDSNDFGPISKSMIEGRAVCVVWPPGRWGEIPDQRDKKHQTMVLKGPGEIAVPLEWE